MSLFVTVREDDTKDLRLMTSVSNLESMRRLVSLELAQPGQSHFMLGDPLTINSRYDMIHSLPQHNILKSHAIPLDCNDTPSCPCAIVLNLYLKYLFQSIHIHFLFLFPIIYELYSSILNFSKTAESLCLSINREPKVVLVTKLLRLIFS